MSLVNSMRERIALRTVHRDERAADAFEYLLVIGVVVVAVVTAAAAFPGGLIGGVIDGVEAAINGIPGFTIPA